MALNVENCDSLSPDDEPKLKYDRMENDVQNILLKDSVSCICVHTKFICLGTQWGVIHLLDHAGNTVPLGTDGRTELQAHAVAVNHISVDASGEYLASCSDDGKVLVYGLYSTDNTHSLSLGREVKSVALDPQYYKSGSGRRFLTGDKKLTLYEKTFLNRLRSTVLCECAGDVQAVEWQDRFVAWASELGVRVYDLGARCSLGLIQWERGPQRPARAHRCNLLWAAPRTLMIGWVDTVRICVIRRRSAAELQARDVTEHLVDPVHTFQTDYYISGLGPLGRQLVLLGVPKEPDPGPAPAPDPDPDPDPGPPPAPRPVLAVADYQDCEFNEVSADTLKIRGYERHAAGAYRLAALPEESRFFIVSPKDVVVAGPLDLDDRVEWLSRHGRYERALAALEAAGGRSPRHSLEQLGAECLARLLAARRPAEAAALCARVCRSDRALWEAQLLKFAEVNQLRAVSGLLPRAPDAALSPHAYELVLYEFLKVEPAGFLRLVREWEPAPYRTGVVIKAALEHLLATEVDKPLLLEALAVLYVRARRYDKALSTYLTLQHPEAFALVRRPDMRHVVRARVLELMRLDAAQAVGVLLAARVPLAAVEAQLAQHEPLLYRYLDAFCRAEPDGRAHGRLVRLYARYDRDKLLPFLRSSDNYPIQEALDECQARGFDAETVFLLGRIGNTREALHIITERLDDMQQAIAFCQEHNDRELWADLAAAAVRRPERVTLLLRRIGTAVDPRVLLRAIPAGAEVLELQRSLAKMMSDYRLQVSAQAACRAVTLRSYAQAHARLVAARRRGLGVGDAGACGACGGRLLARDPAAGAALRVFHCRHAFHAACLPAPPDAVRAVCAVCAAAGADAQRS